MVKWVLSVVLACCIFAVCFAPVNLNAMELWDPHLRGVNEGLAAGMLPPAGIYFINNAYWADFYEYDSSGHKVPGVSLNAYVDVPLLLWSTGLEFLGAHYGVAIAQPFDYTNLEVLNDKGEDIALDNWGLYNTVLVPGILAWDLPHNFHVAGSLSFYLNDGSSSPGHHPAGRIAAWSSNDFYTIEPGIDHLAA